MWNYYLLKTQPSGKIKESVALLTDKTDNCLYLSLKSIKIQIKIPYNEGQKTIWVLIIIYIFRIWHFSSLK